MRSYMSSTLYIYIYIYIRTHTDIQAYTCMLLSACTYRSPKTEDRAGIYGQAAVLRGYDGMPARV